MSIKINLLPPGHEINSSLWRVMKFIRMLNVIGLAGFIIFALVLGTFFAISTFRLRTLDDNVNRLKNQVSNEEVSEQRLVLLKNRLDRIKTVKSLTSSAKNLTNIDNLLSTLGSDTNLTEIDIDRDKIDVSFLFKTDSDLSLFLSSIKDLKIFKSVVLSSFSYNPENGYLATFHML